MGLDNPANWISGGLLAVMPVGLLLVALPTVATTRRAAVNARNRVRWAAIMALFAALAADLSFLLGSRTSLILATCPLPGLDFALPISVIVNGITLALATLVSFVITIIAHHSVQYLDGDPQQARFARLLAFTAGFFLLVVIAGNIGFFTLSIIATGYSLHRMLMFYRDRPKAIMAAHKKSIFSRTADLCLIVASILIGQSVGSLQFDKITAFVTQTNNLPTSLQIAAWLIVAAVILKSAHFPFHGWLIQVMDAPTPVSALMHAGVVYSGAIIALRTSPLLVHETDALLFLGVMGLVTIVVASLVMTTQSAIKSMLAWSTAAQLGFMSLELGLGLFALALLHLIGHSLYKAHAFLSSGGITDQLRRVPPGGKKNVSSLSWLAAVSLGVIMSAGGAAIFGENVIHDPAWIALVAIIAIAISQIIIRGFQFDDWADRIMAVLIAASMGAVYLILHSLFVWGFSRDVAVREETTTSAYLGLVGLTAVSFLLMSWIQGPGKSKMPRAFQLALFTHLYNGLYADYWVEQFSHRFWSEKVGIELPRKNLAIESMESMAQNQELAPGAGAAQ